MSVTFSIENRYGKAVYGEHTASTCKRKVVFVQHGLGGQRRQPYLFAIKRKLEAIGYFVCTFDTTNSFGESDGNLNEALFSRHCEDLEDVIIWAEKQLWYKEPFYLVGHSLGAASVLRFAAIHPRKVLRTALLSLVTGYNEWVYAFQNYRPDDWCKWQEMGYLPKIDVATNRAGSIGKDFLESLKQVGEGYNLSTPSLFISGTADKTTPEECIRRYHTSLSSNLRKQSPILLFSGAPHTFEKAEDIERQADFICDWFGQGNVYI
jgi:pimeloyl-ACP methyl ester carboxylesterase